MFSKLGTKIALRKAGLPTNTLDFDGSMMGGGKEGGGGIPFANPFAKMTVPKALVSWQTPALPPVEVAGAPVLGGKAPEGDTMGKLRVEAGRACVVVFLRFCGCPFAEKAFLEARRLANKYPAIKFYVVSHCSAKATEKWVSQLGGAWSVNVVVDEEREVYAKWGLGVSNSWYLMNPWTVAAQRRLGNEEGIWAREVGESGNRWVIGGAWGCDGMGTVRWGGASKSADDVPNLVEACGALGAK